MKKFWAADHVSKSAQFRSSPNGSNPDNVVAVGIGMLVTVGMGVLVAIDDGVAVTGVGTAGVGVEDGDAVICGVGGSVAVGAVGDEIIVDWVVAGGGVDVAVAVVGRATGGGDGAATAVAVGRGSGFGRGAFGVCVGATYVEAGAVPAESPVGSGAVVTVGVAVTITVS
jgi:hypothetical protein